ncbi:MAG: hypothetical protein JXR78_12675 [Victivallales bacterium]|nr:hypothetical protein [Victivallales bacterium]
MNKYPHKPNAIDIHNMDSNADNFSIKEQGSSQRNALEVIINELKLSDADKAKLLSDLRYMNITDDNDPLVKITLMSGIYAKYTGSMIDQMVVERKNIEKSFKFLEEQGDFCKSLLQEIRSNIAIWHQHSIEERQKVIDQLEKEKAKLDIKIASNQSLLNEQRATLNLYWFRVGITFVVAITIVSIAIFAAKSYSFDTLKEKYQEKRKIVEKYNSTPRIIPCEGRYYVELQSYKTYHFDNIPGKYAELKRW